MVKYGEVIVMKLDDLKPHELTDIFAAGGMVIGLFLAIGYGLTELALALATGLAGITRATTRN